MPKSEKGFANATPAAFVALSLVCFGLFGTLSGRVDHSALLLFACWQFGAFVIQLVVAIIELKDKETSGGNVFLYFACFFMLVGSLESFTKYMAMVHQLPLSTAIDGYAWLVLALATTLFTPSFLSTSKVLFFTLVTADVGIWGVALGDLGLVGAGIYQLSAICMLIMAILGLWLAFAGVTNGQLKKNIIPVGSPFIKVEEPSKDS